MEISSNILMKDPYRKSGTTPFDECIFSKYKVKVTALFCMLDGKHHIFLADFS